MTDAPALLLRAMLVALALFAAAACGDRGDVVELRYETGALRARGRVAVDPNGDLRLEGRWKFWYANGTLQCQGEFDDVLDKRRRKSLATRRDELLATP